MEVNRRTFVTGMAFAGGAAAGIMLSPAPWYLLRDAAFWTQNWPWVPVPAAGESTYEDGICRVCDAACGIRFRKVDGRLVRVSGNRNHPVNHGSLCPLGTGSLQMFYSASRITTPLKRTGSRVAPSWEAVAWESALDEIVQRISQLRASEKSHMLACITRNENTTTNQLLERLLQAIGSPNFIKLSASFDAIDMTHRIMQGGQAAFDIERSRCILSFGCGLFEGWGGLGRMSHAKSVWAAQLRDKRPLIIQIEPNLTITAGQASRWVPLNPGTEAALALGIAHVLIRDKLYAQPFVEEKCFGFGDWKDADGKVHGGFASEVLAGYPPKAVESITGVPTREIEELAHLFASARPALALGGGGRGDQFSSLYTLMAVHSLNALVGNIDVPGGIIRQAQPPLKRLPDVTKDAESKRGLRTPRCDGALAQYPLAGSLAHNIDTRRVELLFIHDVNPYYLLPNRPTTEDLFQGGTPYIVSLSSYMDESTAHADLILPISAPIERWDDFIGVPGLPYAVYNLSHPVVPPVWDTRSAGDVAIRIAEQLGGSIKESFPWNSTAELLKERAQELYEANRGIVNLSEIEAAGKNIPKLQEQYPTFPAFWAALYESGCWYGPLEYDGEKGFGTPSGKFEFVSRKLLDDLHFSSDLKCMPHYVEPVAAPEGFDLTVLPENLSMMAIDGQATPPMLIKQINDTTLQEDTLFVRLNPVTAMYHQLNEGDEIVLETSMGAAAVRVHISAGVREGVVLIPLGFGHTAYDRFLQNKGINARQLLEVQTDPVSGLLCCSGTPGKIRKA